MTLDAETWLALSDLVHRYAARVDDRRFEEVVDLFAAEATLAVPDPARTLNPTVVHQGHAEIRQAIEAVAAAGRTQHAIVGEVYAAENNAARGRVSCIAHHWTVRDEKVTDIVWHLRYDDEYIRTDAGWRIACRRLTIDAIETRPVRRLRPDET